MYVFYSKCPRVRATDRRYTEEEVLRADNNRGGHRSPTVLHYMVGVSQMSLTTAGDYSCVLFAMITSCETKICYREI
jgi:hypothetical protein